MTIERGFQLIPNSGYLDTSAYNRPFDDQTQPKLFLETQAVVIILQMVEDKAVRLTAIISLLVTSS